jgi:hypothetical protein
LAAFSVAAVAATLAASPADAQQPRRQPAPKPAAAPAAAPVKLPEVTVVGIQVVSAKIGDDDWSLKPFNASNGTKLVLFVKMPPGVGLIELDEDTSVLDTFTDDRGSRLGGDFGSFPDEAKDGSAGTIDIESDALPAIGATSLAASGTLGVKVATSSKPTKVTNVRLENDKSFKLGAVPVTVAEVATEGEEQTFTLKLPRQVMEGIRGIKFFDAKGEEIEGRRTSSGYMNDDAEMGLSVKSTAKTITIEFDQWQGLRELKVPFDVKAGVGLTQ